MTDDSLFAEAVEYARPFVRNMVLKIPNQAPPEHADALLPQNDTPSEILTFELSVDAYLAMANSNSFAFEVLKSLAAACLRANRRMPANLTGFAADTLDGSRACPKAPRGRQPDSQHDRLALGLLVRRVAEKIGIPEYYTDNPKAVTAAHAIVAAMEREGRYVSHATVVNARKSLGDVIR